MSNSKESLTDVMATVNDDLFDVASLLTLVLNDPELTRQQPGISRVIRMARERIDEVQLQLNAHI